MDINNYILEDVCIRKTIDQNILVEINGVYDQELQHMKYCVYYGNDKLYESVYLEECEYYCDERGYEIIS